MNKEHISLEVEVYEDAAALDTTDRQLIESARKETDNAWAPYSEFRVGAVARLVNGEIVKGTNQENASYPAGICAERVLMSAASSLYPGVAIDTLAVSYHNMNGSSNKPISPCGICRQSLYEFQSRTSHKIRVILSGLEGKVYVINDAAHLLPLVFGAEDMK